MPRDASNRDPAVTSTEHPLELIDVQPAASKKTAGVTKVAAARIQAVQKPGAPPSIDHCPMNTKEIATHSILENMTLEQFPDITAAMNAEEPEDAIIRIVANFLGGGLITGGAGIGSNEESLDGLWPLPNFKVWEWLLKNIHETSPDKCGPILDLVDHLQKGVANLKEFSEDLVKLEKSFSKKETELQEAALKYAKKIQNLHPGEFLPIYGGWGNVGGGTGHALVYEFTRRDDSHFDVYVYTSTGHQLTDTLLSGDKSRLKPVIHYSGVPEEYLLFNGDATVRPNFIQALMEIEVLAHWDNNPEVDDEDVLRVFDHIEPYRRKVSLEEFGAIGGQRAGTCVPSSTKQWMRRHAKEQGLYKQLMHQLMLRLLVGTYNSLKEEIKVDSERGALARRLLQQSARNLLRSTAKLTGGTDGGSPLIDADAAKEGQATAYDLLQQIEKAESDITEKHSTQRVASDLSQVDTSPQQCQRKQIVLSAHPSTGYSSARRTNLPSLDTIDSPKNVSTTLDSAMNALKNSFPTARMSNLAIHHLLNQLPLPRIPSAPTDKVPPGEYWIDQVSDDFWDQLSPEEMQGCLDSLRKLSQLYYNTSSNDFPTRRHANIFTLHTLTHFLALKIDAAQNKTTGTTAPAARLESYKIPSFCEEPNNLEGLIYYDRQEYERTQQAYRYFKTFNDFAQIPELFESEDTTDVAKKSIFASNTNGQYWHALLGNDKDLKAAVEKWGDTHFPDLTDKQIQEDYEWEQKKYKEYQEQMRAWGEEQEYIRALNYHQSHRGKKPTDPFIGKARPQQPYDTVAPPQRKVNLPPDTKASMALESMHAGDNELLRGKYSHVIALRTMTHVSREWMRAPQRYPRQGLTCEAHRESPYSYKSSVTKPGSTKNLHENLSKEPLQSHRALSSTHESGVMMDPAASRKVSGSFRTKAEWQALGQTDPFHARILRSLPEWKLAPYQLMLEFSKDLDKLRDPSMQSLFCRLFFRSPVNNKGEAKLGAGQLIVEDEALLKNATQFISKGLNYFESLPEGNVEGGRFFFEMAFYLSKYLADAGQNKKADTLSQINMLNGWLKQSSFNDKDRATLHLHRILFYSLKPTSELNTDDLAAIYESWTSYNLFPEQQKWKSPTLVGIVKNFVAELTIKKKEQLVAEEVSSPICIGILRSLGLDQCEDTMPWRPDEKLGYPYFKTGTEDRFWQINLAKGTIYSEVGQAGGVPPNCPWTWQTEFCRLFPDKQKLLYRSLGNGNVAFNHPTHGPFRLINYSRGYYIQHQFPGSDRWFEYITPKDTEAFPRSLESDHTHWEPVDHHIDFIRYIADLKKLNRKFGVKRDGVILEVDPKTGAATETSRQVDFLQTSNASTSVRGLENFEHRKNILLYTDREGTVQKLTFPRYTSQEGNPLSFRPVKGQMAWSDNRQYVLPARMPTHFLGTIENYLYLEPSDGQGPSKLLVPFQEISMPRNAPVPRGSLERDNTEPLMPPKDATGEQRGLYQYFEFNVDGGQVKATTLEGQLFLAYLHLSQKRYADAIELIRKVKPTESVSPMGMRVLGLIQDLPLGEDHPEAKMVFLHALLLSMKEKDKASREVVKSYFCGIEYTKLRTSMVYLTDCLQSLNNIALCCRLTQDEEIQLIDALLREANNPDQAPDFDTVAMRLDRRRKFLESDKQLPPNHKYLHEAARKTGEDLEALSSYEGIFKSFPLKPKKPGLFRSEEWEKNYYNSLLETRERGVAFLTVGQPSLQVTRPPRGFDASKDGAMLIEVCRIAKKGTQSERNAMLWNLVQWLRGTGPYDYTHKHALMLMIYMLRYPATFPKPIKTKTASSKAKIRFMDQIRKAAKDIKTKENETLKFDSYNSVYPFKTFMKDMFPAGEPERPNTPGVTLEKTPYPIPKQSVFDFREPKLEDFGEERQSFDVKLNSNITRWNQLGEWKQKYLAEDPNAQMPAQESNFILKFDESLVSNNEEDYRESLRRDLDLLQKEYAVGKQQNENAVQMTITSQHCTELGKAAKSQLEEIHKKRTAKETQLHAHANIKNADQLIRQAEMAKIGGGVTREVTSQDCLDCVLTLDGREFQRKNRNLHDGDQLKVLASLTLDIEDLKSHEAQLKRIADLTQKIEKIETNADPTRQYMCQQLEGELNARYHFDKLDKDVQIALRVFAGETGLIPFGKQTELLAKMLEMDATDPDRFNDIVIQLLMGGGKTSVLATIILYLSAKRRGRLALFIVPPALFETVRSNFSEATLQAFNKDVLSIDVDREDLTQHKLRGVLNSLSKAKDKGLPIIMKATSLQCFELELLSEARSLARSRYQQTKARLQALRTGLQEGNSQYLMLLKESQTTVEKIKLLQEVTRQFPECADALLDEVDLLLDALQEVNFPAGDVQPVDPVSNSLLHKVYHTMTRKDLKVATLNGTPSIANIVQLASNEQTLMNVETYKTHVIPVIAKTIAEDFKPVRDHLEGFQDSFTRYTTGKTPNFLQAFADDPNLELTTENLASKAPEWEKLYSIQDLEDDLAFLKFIEELYLSPEQSKKNAANLIALTRHFLLELTPATLQKSGNRHYGTLPNDPMGRIVPFLAVNTPATTKFGYHWEEACYYYQWAAAFPPKIEQIQQHADVTATTARHYVQKNGEPFNKTIEYEEFARIFGITLDDIENSTKLEDAVEFIGKDVKLRLDLQYEVVSQNVAFHTERLNSNGMALVDQLASRRTMSGTPWNVEGFAACLAKRYHPDEGTEGKILHTLAKRAANKHIYALEFNTIDEFLEPVFSDHKHPEKIRGIIEAGGLFKVFRDNAQVAQSIMAFIAQKQEAKKIDDSIEGVLFFHKDPGQAQSDTLYVWRKGSKVPERIGGSSVQALKAKGMDPSKYFTYYDERHTTGTDILQLPDAINLFTFDEKMILRTVGQGIMRLRQYLFTQDVEVIVSKSAQKTLVHGGQTIEDLVLSAEKIQSIRKSNDMVRYYRLQIDNIFRRQAVKKIMEAAEDITNAIKFANIVSQYQSFFVSTIQEAPFLQHGKLKQNVDTQEMLQNYLERKLGAFRGLVTDQDVLAIVEQDASEMKEHIREAKSLPKTWEETPSNIGVEQEVEQQQETAVKVQVEMEVESEILLELQKYTQETSLEPRIDLGLQKDEFLTMLSALRTKAAAPPTMIKLPDQLSRFEYGLLNQRFHFENAFRAPIYGTKAYFYSCEGETVLPVFHPLQRPPEQILAVLHEGKMRWLLLSEHEANSVRNHLKKLYRAEDPSVENVWLIQPDGSLLLDSGQSGPFPLGEESVSEGLLEINAFAGNADYIERHADETEEWLTTEPELIIRFLKLRTARDKRQYNILQGTPIIRKYDPETCSNPHQHMFRARAEREATRQGELILENDVAVKCLSPGKVGNLHVRLVSSLGIDWNKRKSDPTIKAALHNIQTEMTTRDKKAPTEKELKGEAERLTARQFAKLAVFQGPFLTTDQVRWLPPAKVDILARPDQIYRYKKNGQIEYLLTEDQALGLGKHQQHLIPYINPNFYPKLTEQWQIQAVDPRHVGKVNTEYYHFLRKTQVKAIPKEKVEFLQKLGAPKKFSWVHGNLLSKIPKQHLDRVSAEQICEITDSKLIPELEKIAKSHKGLHEIPEELWTSWVAPNMVPYVSKEQLKHLKSKEQIKEVDRTRVHLLDPETQVPLIDTSQVSALDANQIKKCPSALIKHLKPDQVQHLRPSQLGHLEGANLLQTIQDADRFKHLHPHQMRWIEKKQLLLIDTTHVPGLSNEQILWLSHDITPQQWQGLCEGLTEHQVQSFRTSDLIDLLSPEQVRHWLTTRQVPLLRKLEHVKACHGNLVRYLDLKQLQMISNEQVPFLHGNQIASVESDRVPLLTAEEPDDARTINQMAWISDEQLAWVTPKQVPGLNLPQIEKLSKMDCWSELSQNITPEQIQQYDSLSLINLLKPDQIREHLSDRQVHLLTSPEQIHACPTHLIKNLDPTAQVPHINENQVPYLEGPKQIQSCPQALVEHLDPVTQVQHISQDQVPYLDKAQFEYLPPKLAKSLLPKQIELMNSAIETAKLTQEQFIYLGAQGVRTLSDEQVEENQDKVAPALHPARLRLITAPEGLEKITPEQINEFGAYYNKLPKDHPLWGRITRGAVAQVDYDHISSLPLEKFQFLTEGQIRKISFWKVKHLTRSQLRKRSWVQSIGYTLGVTVLGVISAVGALFAHLTLIPVLIRLFSKKKGNVVMRKLHANPKRLYRHIKIHLSPKRSEYSDLP